MVNLHNSFFFFLYFYNILHCFVVFTFPLQSVNSSNLLSSSLYFQNFFNTLSKDGIPDILAPAYDLTEKSLDLLLVDVQIQTLQFVVQIFCLLF